MTAIFTADKTPVIRIEKKVGVITGRAESRISAGANEFSD
jgi:hypothetical protein